MPLVMTITGSLHCLLNMVKMFDYQKLMFVPALVQRLLGYTV